MWMSKPLNSTPVLAYAQMPQYIDVQLGTPLI